MNRYVLYFRKINWGLLCSYKYILSLIIFINCREHKNKKEEGRDQNKTSDRLRVAGITGSKKRLPTGIQSLSSSSEEVQIRGISNISSW